MSSTAESNTTVDLQADCQNCGGPVAIVVGSDSTLCRHCGHRNPLAQPVECVEDFRFLGDFERLMAECGTLEVVSAECDGCGTEMEWSACSDDQRCPCCGGALDVHAGTVSLMRPHAALAFQVSPQQAAEAFREWMLEQWLVPERLRKNASGTETMHAVYLPCWVFGVKTVSTFVGQRGRHHNELQVNGKDRERVQRTRWEPHSGKLAGRFEDQHVLASHPLPAKYLEEVGPFEGVRQAFETAFLDGRATQACEIDHQEAFLQVKERINSLIEAQIKDHIGGDTQRLDSLSTDCQEINACLTLVPLWCGHYTHKGNNHRFVINGTTARTSGEVPECVVKSWLLNLAALGMAVFAIWLLIKFLAWCW